MAILTEPFRQHHKHCDDLFVEAEAAVAAKDWTNASELLAAFHTELETHFRTEEEVLFPAFEAATGMTMGPTRMMRFEHAQMRELLDQMGTALDKPDRDNFSGAAETLLIFMQQHNMKEENILYPMCDRGLAAQVDVLAPVIHDKLKAVCLTMQ
ncbi:MAG: hemerythrin domain-containing protein [Rhodocyclaceae bacterium]|nr:hemerythrin domain-containing protein [Rhodocyclaceae bacterium]